jgi:hypothetical protein
MLDEPEEFADVGLAWQSPDVSVGMVALCVDCNEVPREHGTVQGQRDKFCDYNRAQRIS